MAFNWSAFGAGFAGGIADQLEENAKERRYLRRQMIEHGMRMAENYTEEKLRAAREIESADAVAGLYGWSRDKALAYLRLPEPERKRLEENYFMGGPDVQPAQAGTSSQSTPAAAPATAPAVAAPTYKRGDQASMNAAVVAATGNAGMQDTRSFFERTMGKPDLASIRKDVTGIVGAAYGFDQAEASRAMQGRAGVERPTVGTLPALQRKPEGFAEMSSVFLKSAPDVAKEDKQAYFEAWKVWASAKSTPEERAEAARKMAGLIPGFDEKMQAKIEQALLQAQARLEGARIAAAARIQAAELGAGGRLNAALDDIQTRYQNWLKHQPSFQFNGETIVPKAGLGTQKLEELVNARASQLVMVGKLDAAQAWSQIQKELQAGKIDFDYIPKSNALASGTTASAQTTEISVELPEEARKQLKEGVITKFANGQMWTLENGKPRRLGFQ